MIRILFYGLCFLVILMTISFSKEIHYYNNDGESFADVKINDLVFNCRVAGLENSGDAIILLHGFPETSRMWHNLIKVLVENNYRVIAPDQRGYSQKARPNNIEDYRIDKLSDDVINIANQFGVNKFHLVGHDWGSAVGWYLSSKHPNRLITFTALSVPHIDAFFEMMKTNKEQQKKSQYISWFRRPVLPEIYFKIFGYKNLDRIWNKSSDKEKQKYLEIFKQKGALRATLNWYRANINNSSESIGDIYTSTLIIYGRKDMAVAERSVDESEKFLKGEYYIEKIDSGHWLIQESFDVVSNTILNHIN